MTTLETLRALATFSTPSEGGGPQGGGDAARTAWVILAVIGAAVVALLLIPAVFGVVMALFGAVFWFIGVIFSVIFGVIGFILHAVWILLPFAILIAIGYAIAVYVMSRRDKS